MTWGIGSGGTRVRTDSVTGMHMTAAQTFTIAALSAAFWRGYGTGPDAPGQLLVALSGISATGTPNDSVWFRRIIYDYAGRLSMYGGLQRKRLSTDCTYDKPVLGYYCNYGPGSTYDVYSYDLAGNIDSVHLGGGSTVARTYGMGNRLLTLGSITYTYDADGNLSTRVAGGVTTNYYWSADGLLDSVHAGTVTLQYSYNAERQLIQRRRNGMAERYFLWDHDHLMLELDTTVTGRVVEYAYLPGVDRPLAYATGATSTPPIMYLQQDAQGNVIGAMDSTGAVRQQLSYDAWGTSTLIGSDPEQRLRWKGMVWEGDSTRMYYVRTRWYDPQSGRFLSEDPAGLQGGLNLYMFGGNDPVNQSDPIGLCSPMPQCLYGWGSLHEQWKAFVAGAQQAANSVVNSIINNLRESLDRTAACLADPVCAVVSTQGGELEGIGEEAGAEAIGGHFAATQLIERSWYSSTFADAWATAYYHLEKHGEGKTLEQYTQDALDFFQQNRGRGQSVILEDGTPGIRIKQKGGPGGYFTPDGKIVTFWYR